MSPSAGALKVGVLIRTYNEAAWIERCVDSMRSQDAYRAADVRILVIDSGSTDGTARLAREKGCEVFEIPKETFNYGRALNMGFDILGDRDAVVCVSAHAIPADGRFLGELTAPLADPRVAAAYARQIPWDDADFAERIRIEDSFPEAERGKAFTDVEGLSFSNAASCVRHSDWRERPFLELPASEDIEWASDAILRRGKAVFYAPAALIRHSHRESVARRARRLLEFLERSFEEERVPAEARRSKVFRNGLHNIRWTLRLALTRRGSARDKAVALLRSVGELFAMVRAYRESTAKAGKAGQ